jgi:hypothetical protein
VKWYGELDVEPIVCHAPDAAGAYWNSTFAMPEPESVALPASVACGPPTTRPAGGAVSVAVGDVL